MKTSLLKAFESSVNAGDSGGNEMEACLKVLKLAMARLGEEDEKSRAEKSAKTCGST